MKTIIKDLQKGMTIGLGIVIILLITGVSYAVWDGLNAESGDSLTAAKWNELVYKVSGIYTDSNGNVGIGTETPLAKLHINSDNSSGIIVGRSPTVKGHFLWDSTLDYLRFMTNGADYPISIGNGNEIFVDLPNAGNVGIGTTTPTRTLDVNGSIRFNGLCIDSGIYGDGSQLSISTTNSYAITFNESFTSKPTINVTPECSSTCTGFQEDGFNIGNVSNTAFSVNWVDNSGSSGIYYLHWIAIGPCN